MSKSVVKQSDESLKEAPSARQCQRRFGSMHAGPKAAQKKVAQRKAAEKKVAQRWRTMSPEHRARYLRSGYRSEIPVRAIKQAKAQDAMASSTVFIRDWSDSSTDEDEEQHASSKRCRNKKSAVAAKRKKA
ncbi:uncharacterized protein LOC117579580 [Drosophila guanche]|uniref:Uncharacterized protein n=1 Tax=Drosophila guanche TaxID=7266 RepID=A0A3B0J5S8_DROGU|nr:uncharacterized protein LOC117579580 [Drosophila guanche]SPP77197.1 Hypothetical predicted protein [Drosophila guanche]